MIQSKKYSCLQRRNKSDCNRNSASCCRLACSKGIRTLQPCAEAGKPKPLFPALLAALECDLGSAKTMHSSETGFRTEPRWGEGGRGASTELELIIAETTPESAFQFCHQLPGGGLGHRVLEPLGVTVAPDSALPDWGWRSSPAGSPGLPLGVTHGRSSKGRAVL